MFGRVRPRTADVFRTRECAIMVDRTVPNEERPGVRDLARLGVLSNYVESASDDERRRLRAEAYEIAMPVVFDQLTRGLELKRGHRRCAASVHGLEDDCLERFHNDMDAVLEYLFRRARVPILNLEGWIRTRLTAATIDAYRSRRGARGALQRPRVPGWLATRLDNDPELMTLAVDMLEFVGLEATAGMEVWPVSVWAARRVAPGDDLEAAQRAVAKDIEAVLAAMRSRPKWYAAYVERPLGRKRAPLLMPPRSGPDATEEQVPSQTARDDAGDARVTELAAVAVVAIEARLARGEDPQTVVVDVLTTVFGSGVGAEDLDRRPGETPTIDERIVARLTDQATIDRIVAVVLEILADKGR